MNKPLNPETNSFFGADKRLLFVLLCLITFLLLYLKIVFIEEATAAFEFLQDKPEGTVLRAISTAKFVSIPLVYLWKFTVIAFVIWVGCFMFGYRVSYAQCWGVVIAAEYIFIVPELLKIFWFFLIQTDPSYNDIRSFYPLSLMHFADYETMDRRWAYPLRALNVFEIAYWFMLVEGIHHYARKDKKYVRIIVACSYILLFFIWLLFYAAVYK